MKKIIETILSFLGICGGGISMLLIATFIFLLILFFGGLIFWGIGAFIIWVFKINFEWTFLHGVAAEMIFFLLKQIFGTEKIVKKGE